MRKQQQNGISILMQLIVNSGELFYNPLYYTYDNDFGHADGHYGYGYTGSRFTGYVEGDSELSMELFEERTALQTLQRLLNSYLPIVLFISCIFLSVDIVLKDRRNPSLLKGFPIADWKKLLYERNSCFYRKYYVIHSSMCRFYNYWVTKWLW